MRLDDELRKIREAGTAFIEALDKLPLAPTGSTTMMAQAQHRFTESVMWAEYHVRTVNRELKELDDRNRNKPHE